MKKKEIKETMAKIHKMDDVELLMTTMGIARAEAVADYIMSPAKIELEDDLALYMGSLVGRLSPRMVKSPFKKSIA